MSLRKLFPVLGLAACAVLLVGQVRALLADPSVWPPDDFVEYWAAGRLNLGGQNPYSPDLLLPLERAAGRDTDDAVMMWNPPWTLAVAMPIGALPARVAQLVWLLVGLAAVAGSAWLLSESSNQKWVPFAVAFTFLPTYLVLQAGQITFVVLLGLAGFGWCLRHGYGFAAGLAAVLVAVKPHLAYLLWPAVAIDAVANRRASVILGGVAGGLVASGVAAAFNPDVFGQYVAEMSQRPPAQWKSLTLGTVLREIFGADRFWLQFVPVGLGLGWFAVRSVNRPMKRDWSGELPWLVLVSFLTSPYGAWHFDLVVLLVPLIHLATSFPPLQGGKKPEPPPPLGGRVGVGGDFPPEATPADPSTSREFGIVAVYLAMNLGMLALNLAGVWSFWFAWVAPVVLWLYWRAGPR